MQKDYETFVEKLEIGIYEATAVSYTHLDVYKRQPYGWQVRRADGC